jgi:hypothetical protein
VVAARALDVGLTSGHGRVIVTNADDLRHAFQVRCEIRNNRRRELHGPLFTGDVRTIGIPHEPVTVGVNPAIQSMARDCVDDLGGVIRRNEALRHY